MAKYTFDLNDTTIMLLGQMKDELGQKNIGETIAALVTTFHLIKSESGLQVLEKMALEQTKDVTK